MSNNSSNFSVSRVLRFPVKSLAGEDLRQAVILPEGIQYDRRWMIVDSLGKFITQRKHHKMALIKSRVVENILSITIPNCVEQKIKITNTNNWKEVTVWKDSLRSLVVDENIDNLLSDYLGISCHLVMMSDQEPRKNNDPVGDGYVSFADAFPYLLIGTASLEKLNQKLVNKVSMDNFRPNIVINTSEANEEDNWDVIQIGEVRFRNVKLCSRCILITVNPETAKRYDSSEPLKTLSGYRKAETGEIMFGCNLLALNKGKIQEGDEVKVLSYINKN